MGLKRYLLFAGGGYYPQGGWDDFVIDTDTDTEAILSMNDVLFECGDMVVGGHAIVGDEPWTMIVDSHNREVIAEYSWSAGYGDKSEGKWLRDQDRPK